MVEELGFVFEGLEQVDLYGAGDGVERQGVGVVGEGLFELVSEGVHAEEAVGDEGADDGRGVAERGYQAEGQQQAEQDRGAVQQQDVGEGCWSEKHAFADALDIGEGVDVIVEGSVEDIGDFAALEGLGEVEGQGFEKVVGNAVAG